MTKFSLLLLVHNRIGKGTYWRAWGFARELAQRDFDVTLVTAASQPRYSVTQYIKSGVTVVEIPELLRGSGYDPWGTIQRLRWLKGHSFDLIHSFETRPSNIGPALFLQRRYNSQLVLDWCDWFGRGGSVEERPNPLIRSMLRPIETFFEESFRLAAGATTVINSFLRQRAIELGVDSDQIIILPNGANVDRVPQDRKQVRVRLGLPVNMPILVHTGAMFQRDAELLADTLNIIHHTLPDVLLLLVGYCNIAVEEMVQTPEAVIRTGPIDYNKLVDYVAAGDIGVLPLRNSGANRGRFPMKLHDFMAAGRAVVTTDIGDLGKIVRHKSVGKVVSDNPLELADGAIALLTNITARSQMERRARQYAEEKLSWPIVTNKLELLYRQLLDQVHGDNRYRDRGSRFPISDS